MGITIEAITGHNLTISEVLKLPQQLYNDKNIHQAALAIHEYNNNITEKEFRSELTSWLWDYENSVNEIERLWELEKNDEDNLYQPTYFYTNFCALYINRKTIEISFDCRYFFFHNPNNSQPLYIQFATAIAEFLNQHTIIFYPDNKDVDQYNLTIDEIEQRATKMFGAPSPDKQTAIGNYYYIKRI